MKWLANLFDRQDAGKTQKFSGIVERIKVMPSDEFNYRIFLLRRGESVVQRLYFEVSPTLTAQDIEAAIMTEADDDIVFSTDANGTYVQTFMNRTYNQLRAQNNARSASHR